MHSKCTASGQLNWTMRTAVWRLSVSVHMDSKPVLCFKPTNLTKIKTVKLKIKMPDYF